MDISKIQWNAIDRHKAEFILSEAKLALQGSVDSNDFLIGKSLQIATVIFSILVAIIGFLITRDEINSQFFPALCQICTCIITLCYLIKMIEPSKAFNLGTPPSNFLQEGVYSQQYKNLILGEALNYQERIEYVRLLNTELAKNLKYSIFTMIAGTTISGIIAIISKSIF